MKRIFIFTLISCVFICCNDDDKNVKNKLNISNENLVKVNSLIESFLSDTLIENVILENKEIFSVDSFFEINNKDSILVILHQNDSLRKKFDSLIKLSDNKRYIFKGDDIYYNNDTLLLYNYLETMKNQKNIIADLYDYKEERFTGWRVRYKYYAKNTRNNYYKTCWDTFILSPEFNTIISFKSNDREKDFGLRREIRKVKSNTNNRQLKYAWFIKGLPIGD